MIFGVPKSEVEHMDHFGVVLKVIMEHQLFSKYSKCEFWLRSVVFLGHIISTESIEVYPCHKDIHYI